MIDTAAQQARPIVREHGLDGLDESTAGISVWDRDGSLIYASRAFVNALPLGDEALDDLTFSRFIKIVADSRELVLDEPVDAWRTTQEAEFGLEKRYEQPTADGRTLEIIQKPSRQGGMTVTLHDVSGLKRVEFALRKAAQDAEASGEAKSRFLRAANHDLRQPLATLRILIYNCMNEPDDEHRRDLLHAMDLSVSIMEDLLNALLQIGQIDAGQIIARVTTFQLNSLFERLQLQFAHQAAEKGVRFHIVQTREAVISDKALLERILANLVANAIRYTNAGSILIGCRRRGNALGIEVWDTGRGIAPEHIEHIFDEFYQVPDNRQVKRQGLGLGLNIVKRLADLLRHPISVRSDLGRGSVFSVAVSSGDVWQSDLGEPEISEMIGGEFAGIPILVIEDDEALRHTMEQLLGRWGVRVTTASSEIEAVAALADGAPVPRLIIADYSLRGQHGTDAVGTLRTQFGSEIPAVIVTADVDPAITERISSLGFPLLIKPVSPPRLRVAMHNLLFEAASLRRDTKKAQ